MTEQRWHARESRELVPLTVTINTVPTTTYEVACVPWGSRPTVWQPPDTADPDHGYLLPGNLPPGVHTLWVRITDNPEVVVQRHVNLIIT